MISDDTTAALLKFAEEETTFFHKLWYKTDQNKMESQGYQVCVMTNLVFKFPELVNIIEKFTINPSQVAIVRQLKNTTAFIHTDGNRQRKTVLATPLTPLESFAPTLFYKANNKDTFYQSCNYLNNCSAFLNTQKFHSVVTSDQERLNFQFAFDMSYVDAISLVLDNKFIKE
jgi:hypothetical protein